MAAMILVERTHWPLVVVGSVPDGEPAGAASLDDASLMAADRLWVVLVVAAIGARARMAQEALLEWLCEHRSILPPRVVRCAWVIEDDTLRSSAASWQALLGPAFDVDAAMFGAVRPALRWLTGGRS
jgi:hypothetical protein